MENRSWGRRIRGLKQSLRYSLFQLPKISQRRSACSPKQLSLDVPVPSAEPETLLKEKPQQAEFGQSHYDIIGQLFSCYWIVQQGESVFFIDQHAAHERRLYERIMNKPLEPDSQMLLMPVIEKLMPEEYQTLMDNLPLFEELGFEIEEFGALTVSVRAVPPYLMRPRRQASSTKRSAGLRQKTGSAQKT